MHANVVRRSLTSLFASGVVTASVIGVLGTAGCGSSAPSTSTAAPAPLNGVYTVQIQTVGSSGLPACSSKTAGETAIVTSTNTLESCVAGVWVPIPCLVGGAVAFDSATDSLWACTEAADGGHPVWAQVTLPKGPAGPQGATGNAGPAGPRGTPGVPGAPGTQLQVSTEPPGPNCAAGGERIDLGPAADGGLQRPVYVCNGASANGPAGVGPCAGDADCNDANPCTLDTCSNGVCGHSYAAYDTVCRPAAGPCDAAEYCSGSSTVCPPDVYAASYVSCGGGLGTCQTATHCSGTSTECPVGAVQAANVICQPASGCNLAATCDGTTRACPAPAIAQQGTVCSGAHGCVSAATCDGVAATCPAPLPAAAGTVCLDAVECYAASICDGTSLECPSYAVAGAGAACTGESNQCGAAGTCDGTDGTTCKVEGIACTVGQNQACTCGTLIPSSQTCTSSCTWGMCARNTVPGSGSEIGSINIPPGDSTVAHDCGADNNGPNGTDWQISTASTGATTSDSCSPGQRIMDWSAALPQGFYNIILGSGGFSGAPDVTTQVFVDGALVDSQAARVSPYMTYYSKHDLQLTGCETLEIRVIFNDAGASAAYDFDPGGIFIY